MSFFEDLQKKISDKSVTVAVIGLGYVGLPLVHSMCKKGLRVYGIDVDQKKIDQLLAGQSYIGAVESSDIETYCSKDLFKPTTDFSCLKDADFIIICVPTPLDKNFAPDLSYVEGTAKSISQHLRKGHVVILESTTYPGTMNEVVAPILNKSGLELGQDYFMAYSPERENPGSETHSTATIPKVIGADTKEALTVSQQFYSIFIDEVVPVGSIAVAEASKIMENTYRSVNIALVNELKVIFDRMGIDIWEVIEAAKTKPFGFTPFYPGPGLGGHCIPIDPFYLSWKAKEYGKVTRFIELAGEINTNMPDYVVDKTVNALNDVKGLAVKGAKILVLGIAYKKNVADQRETPAFPIMDALQARGANVDFYDPLIESVGENRNHPDLAGKKSIAWDVENVKGYDAIVLVTDHDEVDYEALVQSDCLIIDTRNKLSSFKNPKASILQA
ncbi:MAG: nucleotide sugar dehydrogenase [Alphaproteobacteria bacterium]|nr:nucleotide sugar dehydrogenase [Alphaproteobacteria bacterium]